jgi:uncharacterized membrane protein
VGVAIGIGAGVAIGATTGAVIGGAIDLDRADTRQQALVETGFVLHRGQSAVIADVSEDWTPHVDERMERLGGSVHRRSSDNVQNDGKLHDGYHPSADFLYPYEYVPAEYPARAGW